MAQVLSSSENLLELGQLYADRGDFFVAIDKLERALEHYLQKEHEGPLVETINCLCTLYHETEKDIQLSQIKDRIQELIFNQTISLNSKTYHMLAMSSLYKGQHYTSLEFAQKALSLALTANHKNDICYALYAKARVLVHMNQKSEALREISNLQVFFEVLDYPAIKISTLIMYGVLLRESGRMELALEQLWKAYDQLRVHRTALCYISLFFELGKTYFVSGNRDQAQIYIDLARRALDPTTMVRLSKKIREEMGALGTAKTPAFDLIFNLSNHTVQEKKLGKIDFHNQFILLDLLKLFIQNQGKVYSKAFLVEQVWKQDYEPEVHDNKIYVTIKRLRKMIEPDYEKPKYIFRAKKGYFLNKSARILIESTPSKK